MEEKDQYKDHSAETKDVASDDLAVKHPALALRPHFHSVGVLGDDCTAPCCEQLAVAYVVDMQVGHHRGVHCLHDSTPRRALKGDRQKPRVLRDVVLKVKFVFIAAHNNNFEAGVLLCKGVQGWSEFSVDGMMGGFEKSGKKKKRKWLVLSVLLRRQNDKDKLFFLTVLRSRLHGEQKEIWRECNAKRTNTKNKTQFDDPKIALYSPLSANKRDKNKHHTCKVGTKKRCGTVLQQLHRQAPSWCRQDLPPSR